MILRQSPSLRSSSVSPADRQEIALRLESLLRQCEGTLILFGSRARGDPRPASDIDLAVRARHPVPAHLLATARQSLEDSRVPFNIDLLDYATLAPDMRRSIDREGIAWTD